MQNSSSNHENSTAAGTGTNGQARGKEKRVRKTEIALKKATNIQQPQSVFIENNQNADASQRVVISSSKTVNVQIEASNPTQRRQGQALGASRANGAGQ